MIESAAKAATIYHEEREEGEENESRTQQWKQLRKHFRGLRVLHGESLLRLVHPFEIRTKPHYGP
jgi:hypothetical protein